jgi:hypothetical protein
LLACYMRLNTRGPRRTRTPTTGGRTDARQGMSAATLFPRRRRGARCLSQPEGL